MYVDIFLFVNPKFFKLNKERVIRGRLYPRILPYTAFLSIQR